MTLRWCAKTSSFVTRSSSADAAAAAEEDEDEDEDEDDAEDEDEEDEDEGVGGARGGALSRRAAIAAETGRLAGGASAIALPKGVGPGPREQTRV